jgi:membrane protein implicated in regulation of membrane protease activity
MERTPKGAEIWGRMHALLKYLLIQLPQWFGLALFLWFLTDQGAVPRWAGAGFLVFWILKDFATYPFVRRAYENNAKNGSEALVGGKGMTHGPIAPEGYIKIQGELWKARAEGQSIPKDRIVRVTGANGMTLTVEAESKAL